MVFSVLEEKVEFSGCSESVELDMFLVLSSVSFEMELVVKACVE